MSFLDELLENGGHFVGERRENIVTFRAASNRSGDIDSFQTLVHRLREREGDGYSISNEHISSDHGMGLVDVIVLSVRDG